MKPINKYLLFVLEDEEQSLDDNVETSVIDTKHNEDTEEETDRYNSELEYLELTYNANKKGIDSIQKDIDSIKQKIDELDKNQDIEEKRLSLERYEAEKSALNTKLSKLTKDKIDQEKKIEDEYEKSKEKAEKTHKENQDAIDKEWKSSIDKIMKKRKFESKNK